MKNKVGDKIFLIEYLYDFEYNLLELEFEGWYFFKNFRKQYYLNKDVYI